MLRRSAALVLSAALVAVGLVLVPAPAFAADHPVTVDGGTVTDLDGVWGRTAGATLSRSATQFTLTLPTELATKPAQTLNWNWQGSLNNGTAFTNNTIVMNMTPNSYSVGTVTPMFVYHYLDANTPVSMTIWVTIVAGSAPSSFSAQKSNSVIDFVGQDTPTFNVGRDYVSTDPADLRVNWGDTVSISGPAGFWTTGPDNWSDTVLVGSLFSADISSSTGYELDLETRTTVNGSGSTATVTLPSSPPADVNWSTDTVLVLQLLDIVSGDYSSPYVVTWNSFELYVNFHPTDRYSGQDRFVTSALIAQQFATASRVYVANGRNYPDALSAAPAAAHAGGPLLLVDPNVLPEVIRDELVRLNPAEVVVAGGLNQVSQAVRDAIVAALPGVTLVELAGSNRYETSRLVTEFEFGVGATTDAYVVTGRNFPDALAASAAAAHFNGPVILIDGSAAAIDDATQATLDSLGVTKVRIAGSSAVVTDAIEADLVATYGAGDVIRNAGLNRYETSIAINNDAFAGVGASEVYLALGTGYADALSGAALAGAVDAPLFTVPGSCVPQGVLDAITSYGATRVVLLGSIKGLTTAVGNLTAC